MVGIIGWYCVIISVGQAVVLASTAKGENGASLKLRRTILWVSHPIFLLAAVLALRAS